MNEGCMYLPWSCGQCRLRSSSQVPSCQATLQSRSFLHGALWRISPRLLPIENTRALYVTDLDLLQTKHAAIQLLCMRSTPFANDAFAKDTPSSFEALLMFWEVEANASRILVGKKKRRMKSSISEKQYLHARQRSTDCCASCVFRDKFPIKFSHIAALFVTGLPGLLEHWKRVPHFESCCTFPRVVA